MTRHRQLAARAAELLEAEVPIRIEHIKKSMFVPYGRADALLNEMKLLLTLPQSNRPPNLLVVARSNNGKTHILKEFQRRHPANERRSGDTTHAPVVFIQAPPTPDNRLFLDCALRVFNIEARRSATDNEKLQLVLDQLKACDTRVLLIDEIHSILAGPVHRREAVLNTFKYLSNESGVSIVAAGTQAARDALLAASELKSRFGLRYLTRWKVDQDFQVLLARLEAMLPLREESHLSKIAMVNAIFGLSEECIGGAARVVRDAAITALQRGQERITLDIVENMQQARKANVEDGNRL